MFCLKIKAQRSYSTRKMI